MAVAAAVSAEKAGFWIRFFAYLIDFVILLVVNVALVVVLRDAGQALTYLVGIVYFVGFWSYGGGQTLGMRALGIKVVKTDGAELSLVGAVLRYAGLVVSCLALFIGVIWVAFDGQKQGWHDKIAGTYVVRA